MQIDSIEVFHVALPLREPQTTAVGPFDTLETVLVRMTSGSTAGWGEASPGRAPLANPEWAGSVFQCVRDWLAPRLVGKMVDSGKDLQNALAGFRGNQYAKAALDTAWWDLKARRDDQPLHKALGGRSERVEVGASFDQMESPDAFVAAIGRAFEAGFGRVELKFRPGWELNMLNFVRHDFPVERLHVDIEGALHLDNMELICRLDDFCLAMVEQPLPADDLVGHAMIQESLHTPICLDESITSPQQADIALELRSAQFINLKPGRVGGLTPSVAIHDACHENCIPCWVGAVPQTALGMRIGLALAAKPNCTYPADFPFEPLLADDLAPLPELVRDDKEGALQAKLWTEPGLGVEPEPALLEKYTIAQAKL
jgi:O-succinylbenzoate synthase